VFKRTCGLVAFSDSTIAAGQIEIPTDEFVFYDVANTTIGDVHLSLAEEGSYGLFEYFYIKNTTLEGFDFGPYKKELSKSGWLLHTSHLQRSNRRSESNVRDRIAAEYGIPSEVLDKYKSLDQFEGLDGNPFEQLTPADMENTYLKAKNGAAASGDNKAAAEFFRHEMKSRRRVHKHRLFTTDSWTDRLSSGFNYCANLVIGKTTGYGERPRNVVLTSVATIGEFAVLYWFIDALPNGTSSEYLLFSLQNFVTFIIGTQPQEAVSIRYLTAIQAFLGAFLIALFVFTLTRSVNR
jgi:hypothetical protein